jgi:hypothetical protein
VLTGALLLALLNGIALAVAAVLFIDYTREHGPLSSEIPEQTAIVGDEATELANRLAPVLHYDSKELFVPIPRAAYVSRTQLKEQEGRFIRLRQSKVTEESLPESLGACLKGCLLFLDVRSVEPDPPKHSERSYDLIENGLLRAGARPHVYVHVTHYDDTDEIASSTGSCTSSTTGSTSTSRTGSRSRSASTTSATRSASSTRHTRGVRSRTGSGSSTTATTPSSTPPAARTRTTSPPARTACRSAASA